MAGDKGRSRWRLDRDAAEENETEGSTGLLDACNRVAFCPYIGKRQGIPTVQRRILNQLLEFHTIAKSRPIYVAVAFFEVKKNKRKIIFLVLRGHDR